MNTSGNTILFTGGSNGIGLEFAKQLLDLGNTVIITGRDEARVQRAAATLPGVRAVKSDVSQSVEIEPLLKTTTSEFPRLQTSSSSSSASPSTVC